MSSLHLVDPELVSLIEVVEPIEYSVEALPTIRHKCARSIDDYINSLQLPDVDISERLIPGPSGAPAVRVVITRPRQPVPQLPALLWFHGGGYVVGSPRDSDLRIRPLAEAIGCTVISVQYRLAPETCFPEPLNDCYAALRWVYAHARELGVSSSGVAVGGESAGGGLAAALSLSARDQGDVPVLFQLLVYPMLDDRSVLRETPPFTSTHLWTPSANKFGWTSYLGREPGWGDVSPYAAPARAKNLAGLPPAFIGVGALDLFLEEDIDYAHRLIRAGVPTELHVYPGAYHGFDLVSDARVAARFQHDMAEGFRSVVAEVELRLGK